MWGLGIASLRIVRELNDECVGVGEVINGFWECCAGPGAQRNVSSVEGPVVSVSARQLASSASSQLCGSSSLGESVFLHV